MQIDHIALWAKDLEGMKTFYTKYFGAMCGKKYNKLNKRYSSYFLTFPGGGCRIELMHRPDIDQPISRRQLSVTLV